MKNYTLSKVPGRDKGLLMRCMWTYLLFGDVVHDACGKMFHVQRLDLINLIVMFHINVKFTEILSL